MTDAKGNTFENDILKLIFNAVAIGNIADNAASAPLTNLWLSLHTSSPGEAGNQTTNEAAYGAYARKSVARTTAGWTVTGNAAVSAQQDFPAATSGSETIAFLGIGTASSGAGKLLYYGAVTPNISVSSGVTPRVTPTVNEQ